MKFPIEQSFKLTDYFIEKYKSIKPPFGFNGLGEFVFMRTYSRIQEDGTNEAWWQVIRRVVEGIYSIQRQHIEDYGLGWNQSKAQKSAQIMYDKIFNMKMLPSGRALWTMGTPLIMEKGLTPALFNCSFLSTKNIKEDVGLPFANAMDFLMSGVGVGFDTQGVNKVTIQEQKEKAEPFVISDDREGWVEALRLQINSFFGGKKYEFDYSLIRPAGAPIKTFGGTASGHQPLKELLDKICDILTKEIGNELSVTNIVDMFNLVGKAVVAGNVRRSAELALGENTEEFLNLKNYELHPERADYGWASNNSVLGNLGMDYTDIAERIRDNAEPGIIWLENFRKNGRMGDGNNSDHRIEGANPCFSFDSMLLTDQGYVKIGLLSGKEVNLVDKYGKIQKGKVTSSGKQSSIKLRLSNKQTMVCTPDHILQTSLGEMQAQDTKGLSLSPYLNYKELDDFYILLGFIQGDGSLGRLKSDKHLGVEINIGKKDREIYCLLKDRKYTVGDRTVYLQDIRDTLKHLGFSEENLPTRVFPSEYKKFTQHQKASFLRGCFSANGCINSHGRVTYKATSKTFIMQLKNTLENDFDIPSYITTNPAHPIAFENGTFTVKESYDLNISKYESLLKFHNEINFYHAYKKSTLTATLIRKAPYVTSIKDNGVIDVYDFSMPEIHWGVVNGFVVHNCVEIGLESNELCNLCEMFPNNHDSLEEFQSTVKYAYLFAKTITLLNTQWQDTNRVMLRNRRIGLSITGVSQFLANNNIDILKRWMETAYQDAKYYDQIYSDWFAIPESIKITTAKPSGTLSLLAGSTPGIHFPESQYYIRRVRLGNDSPFIKILKESGFHIEAAIGQEESTSVVSFPVFIGENVRTINDVSMWEQLGIAAFVQKYFSDNSVSVTITFKPEEAKDIKYALDLYQYQLKAVSFLPKYESTAYPQMPYEEITKEQYDEMKYNLKEIDFSQLFSYEAFGEKYCTNDTCEI